MHIQKLLKFGHKSHLEELQAGHVYVNHAHFFKQPIEHGIFDMNEGRMSIHHLKNTFIELKPVGSTKWKKLKVTKGNFESWLNMTDTHIFSLFQISEVEAKSKEFYPFSEEIKKMGDHFIIINDPKEFSIRFEKGLRKNNYNYQRGSIKYYDPTSNHRATTPFHKTKEYEYQQEFRYLIKGNTNSPLRFTIESIADISEICETKPIAGLRFIWK